MGEILIGLLDQLRPGVSLPQLLCGAAACELPVSGASLALMADSGPHGVVVGSDDAAAKVENLQFDIGEGPCVDAFTTGQLVQLSDLERSGARRWPGFTAAALDAGVRAVFSFPLQLGGIRLGVLGLYRTTPGGLDDSSLAKALDYAEAAVILLLHLDDPWTAMGLTEDNDNTMGTTLAKSIEDAFESAPEVHQATGMVSVQAAVGLTEALLLMRAHAFSHERGILDVAKDVVRRALRFD